MLRTQDKTNTVPPVKTTPRGHAADKTTPHRNPTWQSLSTRPFIVQTKLNARTRNSPEHPAYRVADRVGFDGGTTPRSGGDDNERIQKAAQRGTSGPGNPLPFLEQIQKPFGKHDVSGIIAHTGSAAGAGSRDLGAAAFTVGNRVVFGKDPDLRTAAHEAAHAVQQRGGFLTSTGIGKGGDQHEQHADAVAELVVQGESAESLLDQYTIGSSGTREAQSVGGSDHSQGLVQLIELSYDDGPDANTRLTLEALQKGGARATFYLVGQKVQAGDNWRIVFDLAAAGNWLGNHAFDWDNAKDNHIFMSGSPAERASKILQTEFAIRDALIKGKADAQANKKWESIPAEYRTYIDTIIATGTGRFRTPGFKSHWYSKGGFSQQAGIELASQVMEAAGLRRFSVSDSVTVDPKDWEPGKTQADVEKAVTTGATKDTDTILLHSRLSASAAATPAILEDFKKKGFTYQAPSRGSATGGAGAGFAGVNASTDWLDRFNSQVSPIGPAVTVNKTDPVDRTVTTQVGIAWIDYGGAQYLALISIENSSSKPGTTIVFLTFVDQDLKEAAIARATPNQPRGIQTIGQKYIRNAPGTPSASAAKR